MTETNRSQFKKRAAALAVASCLSLAPWVAEAAGLGKLTVYSGLGQPLRAELEIGASRDELAGMTARLAPVDAFKQAGVDYSSALTDLRFVVEKRANGQSIVKVTSVKPVNEPFLDFLVELNWPSGRLVREYTFLLDPPEVAAKGTGGQVSVAEAKVVETVRGGGAGSSQPAVTRSAPRQPAPAKVPAEPKKTEANGSRVVQPGETLRKIASETKYDGVSLEQMLVGLFQSNPDAFIGKNINRLKAGAILGIPEQAAVEAVSDAEAKKVYVTQAGDWNAYRQKLAATSAKAPAREESSSQAASGKITAKVEEKAAPADQSKDQVKIAKTEVATKGGAGKAGALNEADQIAKDKALKEAQDRLALLEKNVGELQKLVEMKTQKLAELQQQSAARKDEVKPVEPVKVPEPPKLAEPAKEAEPVKPVEAAKPVEEAKPTEVKPPEPVKPPPPPPEKKPLPVPPPEPEEPSIIDGLLSDPLPLAGGAGILALLAGYFMFKRRREQSSSLETTAAPGPSSLGPNSVFRMTGGQSVDTGNTPPQTGDFSQTGPGTIDTDEVDPVAEADVYMAYGRDTQAEEILLEALQKDPQRTAIHAKLLEIYANRKSLKQFETLASELYAQTGGAGPEWEKVAALGAGLDPANPLYSGVQATPMATFNPDATMIVSSEDLGRATVAMPGALSQLAEMASVPEEPPLELAADTLVLSTPPELAVATEPAEVEEPASDAMSLDFDLGLPEILPEAPAAEPPEKGASEAPAAFDEPYIETMDLAESNALDFDLGAAAPVAEVPAEEAVGELHVEADDLVVDAVDFDLDVPAQAAAEAVEPEASDAAPDFSPEGTMVMPSATDSEIDSAMDAAVSTLVGANAISDSTEEAEPPEPPVEEAPMVDFDLDIDSPATQTMVNSVLENESTATVLNPLPMPSEEFEFDHPELAATSVSPGALDADSLEFDVSLTDSVFLGEPMVQPDFDIGSINLDLAAEPVPEETEETEMAGLAATMVMPEPVAESFADALAEPVRDAQWEEVNTKLDLAKAYEEMGDLEGARELLQEVVGEGPVDLVEQARAILGRIGE